jgi:hypothetical protein
LACLFAKNKKLKHLVVSCCNKITDLGIEALCMGRSLMQINAIQTVSEAYSAKGSKSLSGALGRNKPAKCPEKKKTTTMTMTTISAEIRDNDESDTASSMNTPSPVATVNIALERLEINGCTKLTDESIISISRGLPNLTLLKVRNCDFITDNSLNILVRTCTKLQTLGHYVIDILLL